MTTTDSADVRERVQEYLEKSGLAAQSVRVLPLTGDASDRQYFRVLTQDGGSLVLALYAGAFEFAELPFVRIAELFSRMPVPVPAILGDAAELGILSLEDLGDVTLQAYLGAAPAISHTACYREAVTHIATLQRRGADLHSSEYPCYANAFDIEKLTWELDFFVRHFVGAYRGGTITPTAQRALAEEFDLIARELALEPRVLCHRDYHSRNLMWHRDELYIIDFQDARLGPDTYDLASLLRDSYVDISEQSVEDLIAHFLALRGIADKESEFRRRFDLMALQRNLKALGTFGYQTAIRGNPVYLQYIPRTLRYVRDNLQRYPRFARLHSVLAQYIEELD